MMLHKKTVQFKKKSHPLANHTLHSKRFNTSYCHKKLDTTVTSGDRGVFPPSLATVGIGVEVLGDVTSLGLFLCWNFINGFLIFKMVLN